MTTTTVANMNQPGVGVLGGSGSLNSGAAGHSDEATTAGDPITPDPNRWFFSREQLENTPSRRNGIDSDKELTYRQQSANFIQDMGQRLQVNQLCINTAIVYMHRFYMYHSFTNFHRNPVSTASIFLAAKVEEQPRKLEHVIKVAHYCLNRDGPPIDTKSDAYADQAADLVMTENILLQTLGFDVAIDHPHTHVVKCCQLVRASKDLAQTSYFMATNSLHLTTMCLQYKPTVVACVCIHLTCKWSNWEIPRSKEGRDWFWYVDESVNLDLLKKLTTEFLAIIDKSPSRLKKKIMSLNPTVGGSSTVTLSSFPAFNFETNMPIGSQAGGSGTSRSSSSSSTLGKRPSSAKPNPGYSGLPKQGKVNGSVQHHPSKIQSSAPSVTSKNPPPYPAGSKQGALPGPPMYPKDASQHSKPVPEQAPSSSLPHSANRTSNSHVHGLPHSQQNSSHNSHAKSQQPLHGATVQHFSKPQLNQPKSHSSHKPSNLGAKGSMPTPLLPPGMMQHKPISSSNLHVADKRGPDHRREQPHQPGFPPKKNVADDKRQVHTSSPRLKQEKLDSAASQMLNATSRVNESSKSWENSSSVQTLIETPRIPPGRSSLFSPDPELLDTPTGISSLGKLDMLSPLDDPLSIGARSETSHIDSAFSDMNSSSLFPGMLEFESDNRNSTPKDVLSFGLPEVNSDSVAVASKESDRSLSAGSSASKYSSATVFSNWAGGSTQPKLETSNDSEPHSKKSKKHKKEKHKHKDKSKDRHEEKKEKEEKKHKDKTKDRTKDEKKHKSDKHKKERRKSKEREAGWSHDDQSSASKISHGGRREDASKSSGNRAVTANLESGYMMSNVLPVPASSGLKLKIKAPRPPS